MLKALRTTLTDLLETCAQQQGVSVDAYCAEAVFHPMAAAKYLSAQACLCRTKLLSPEQFRKAALPMVYALAESAVPAPVGQGASWGLGFARRDVPANEPYLITGALVTRALWETAALVPSMVETQEMALAGLRALEAWCAELRASDSLGVPTLPAYSPHTIRPIFNAAACALAVLRDYSKQEGYRARERLAEIWGCRIPGIGWCYEPGSSVVDLLHQGYLFGALLGQPVPDMDAEMLATFSQFAGVGGWADVLHCLPPEGRGGVAPLWARQGVGHQLQLLERPARLWSLGEALVVLSRCAGMKREWLPRATALGTEVLRRLGGAVEPERHYLRHTMHLAHGLAAFLETKRALAHAPEH